MQYRALGSTGLEVSEIGFGAEWIGALDREAVRDMARFASSQGVNIVDCWMSDPEVRSALGYAIAGQRDRWIIQGHIGSTWQDGQYVRTRDLRFVRPAFEDLLERLGTDHIELGMIHFVDRVDEFHAIDQGDFMAYVRELRDTGVIGHIGLSTHNPEVGLLAAAHPDIEMIMFSVNPAFDLMPASDDISVMYDGPTADADALDPVRAQLYAACERENVGITVMKGFAGGRLLDAQKSPFGVALSPVQCIHYALTRPAVASIMVGVETVEQFEQALAYEAAADEARDYASVIAHAPRSAYQGQCTYCGHCAPCSAGINIALVNKYFDLTALHDEVPATLKAHYEALPVTADACTACEACEERCPFGVPIAQRMEQARALFA